MKIYLIGDEEGRYKIGCSKQPKMRRDQLQTANPTTLSIIHAVDVNNGYQVETSMHNRHSAKCINGEWFILEKSDIDRFISDVKRIDENLSFLKNSGNAFI